MARKKQEGEVNKSQTIRDLLKEQPGIKANDAVAKLAAKSVTIKSSLFYIVKGKMAGARSRRRKNKRAAMKMMTASSNGVAMAAKKSDALMTIRKVKTLAGEVGGLRSLMALVDALSE